MESDFPGYDLYLIHVYIHSPDFDNPDCGFCNIPPWPYLADPVVLYPHT